MIPLHIAAPVIVAAVVAFVVVWLGFVPRWRKDTETEESVWQRSVEMGEG